MVVLTESSLIQARATARVTRVIGSAEFPPCLTEPRGNVACPTTRTDDVLARVVDIPQ